MKILSAVFILVLVILSLTPSFLLAMSEYGASTGRSCRFCHYSPAGGGELNGVGRGYLTNGLKLLPGTADNSSSHVSKGNSSASSSSSSTVMSRKDAQKKAREADRARRFTEIERSVLIQRQLTARKIYRNATLKGRKLFHEPGILGAGIQSCADCHKTKDLALKIKSYPKWDENLSEVITFDRKLRYCIYKKMKGKPLSPETSVTVALTVYLNEVKKGIVK